jgi:hypothetical protein
LRCDACLSWQSLYTVASLLRLQSLCALLWLLCAHLLQLLFCTSWAPVSALPPLLLLLSLIQKLILRSMPSLLMLWCLSPALSLLRLRCLRPWSVLRSPVLPPEAASRALLRLYCLVENALPCGHDSLAKGDAMVITAPARPNM